MLAWLGMLARGVGMTDSACAHHRPRRQDSDDGESSDHEPYLLKRRVTWGCTVHRTSVCVVWVKYIDLVPLPAVLPQAFKCSYI